MFKSSVIHLRGRKPVWLIGLVAACLFLFAGVERSQAQYSEIGFSLGGMHYSGEMIRTVNPLSIRPAVSLFYRQNLSSFVSLRYSLSGGFLHGDDAEPIDAFAAERLREFDVFLMQGDVSMEYHFLDFKSENAIARFSPYLALGLGLFYFTGDGNPYDTFSRVQPVIPVGFGIKYIATPRVILGIEYGARKTFFDYLDNVSAGDMNDKNYQYGNWYDNDWYYHFAFSLSYAFYDIPCPHAWK